MILFALTWGVKYPYSIGGERIGLTVKREGFL
jgi:hypothetical protein